MRKALATLSLLSLLISCYGLAVAIHVNTYVQQSQECIALQDATAPCWHHLDGFRWWLP